MLDILWSGMILSGIFYAALNGTMEAVSEGIWSSASEAVSLCVTLAGTLTVWSGLMKIAEESGLIGKWERSLRPFIHFLFPALPSDSEAASYISANVIANMLGLGGAATPAGLKAMKAMAREREQEQEETASNEMCDFLILNISSLQLIPVNMIAYRAQYGSVNPSWVIVPGLCATAASTLAGILFIKTRQIRAYRKHKRGSAAPRRRPVRRIRCGKCGRRPAGWQEE